MLFHIHIDAETLSDSFAEFVTGTLGFSPFRFEQNPVDIPRFAPEYPFTLKLRDEAAFQRTFDLLEAKQSPEPTMTGYIEGEQVSYHKLQRPSPDRQFDPSVPIPFAATWRRLEPGLFRESELHLTIVQSTRDVALRDRLLEMGFFLAVCQQGQRAQSEIYTVQGSQQQIDALRPMVIAYLQSAGGVGHVVLKEERVARWWKSAPGFPLPPVIDRIEVFEAG